ncbi:hypothetical protein AVEN_233524-1 [Araneus ventricosus]|uniref:Uncharacterized protein n=1 Tax=Araneus ventricosus TaxID=182803 RepID=A0A4Y2NAE5_ARAVE|nr:hypothetical protein AVEN_233524-1 [Araneus ventricosus]
MDDILSGLEVAPLRGAGTPWNTLITQIIFNSFQFDSQPCQREVVLGARLVAHRPRRHLAEARTHHLEYQGFRWMFPPENILPHGPKKTTYLNPLMHKYATRSRVEKR